MGLINYNNEKLIKCYFCGEEEVVKYDARVYVCSHCREKFKINGYIDYRNKLFKDGYDLLGEPCCEIEKLRNSIMKSYQKTDAITDDEFNYALTMTNKKNFSQEWVSDFCKRLKSQMADSYNGCLITDNFLIPTGYDDIVVDTKDVFAVTYMTYEKISNFGVELLLCVCFTNDPWIPAIPVLHAGKIGLSSIYKSKGARKAVVDFYTDICPNLTYPVCELKELKKIIKKEEAVRGSIEIKQMKKIISYALDEIKIFDVENFPISVSQNNEDLLNQYGYVSSQLVYEKLKLNKCWSREFWETAIKKWS